jgi:demethylmenaquinone methyltransferase/2-methoxy-6-polyprenyl-1,4-benzoquinol methylase
MFAAIAGRYDRLNSLLSLGLHHLWRRRTVMAADLRQGATLLDLCSGTADLALAFAGRDFRVVATDFCDAMLVRGRRKAMRRGQPVDFALADAQRLPFRDASFDAVSVAFGLRNVDCLTSALGEIYRVLRPGGVAVVLEFGQPNGCVFGPLYRFYSRHLLPRIGGWLSGHSDAYTYLPRTASVFPAGDRFLRVMGKQKFTEMQARPSTGGVVYVYRAIRPDRGDSLQHTRT